MLAYEPQSTAFWLQLAPLWRSSVDISDHCMPCYLRPLSPLSAEPAGVPIPQGVVDLCFFSFIYLYSRVRQFPPPQSRGLSRLPQPQREPLKRCLLTSQLGLRIAGRATGSRRPDPMDIPGIEVVDALRPTSIFIHCTTPLHACTEYCKTNLSPMSSLASVAPARGRLPRLDGAGSSLCFH